MIFPKDKPVIDRELMAFMKETLGRCEWRCIDDHDGYDPRKHGVCWEKCYRKDEPLEMAHIRARGMGGGRRKDLPNELICLHRTCHQRYDRSGQSRKKQELVRLMILERTTFEATAIQEFAERER